MLVSVIIINYNTFTLTCNSIQSIIDYTRDIDYEIILVDNASTKGNPDAFIKRFPNIKLVKSPQNLGFAKGNNLGIQHASGDIILLFNSDAYLIEDSISKSASFLKAHKDIGALTVRLEYEDRKYQHNARKFRSIKNEIFDLFRPLLLCMTYKKRSALMLNQYFRGDYNTYCDWVSGAYMMFNRSLLKYMPGHKLDERFFMYGEDQLWCYQFTQHGFPSYFLADTTAIHIANASTEPAKQLKILRNNLDRELAIMKYRQKGPLYYHFFAIIFKAKENSRYLIKVLLYKIWRYRLK